MTRASGARRRARSKDGKRAADRARELGVSNFNSVTNASRQNNDALLLAFPITTESAEFMRELMGFPPLVVESPPVTGLIA